MSAIFTSITAHALAMSSAPTTNNRMPNGIASIPADLSAVVAGASDSSGLNPNLDRSVDHVKPTRRHRLQAPEIEDSTPATRSFDDVGVEYGSHWKLTRCCICRAATRLLDRGVHLACVAGWLGACRH